MPIHVATGTRVGVVHVTWLSDATGRSPTECDRSPGHDPLGPVSQMPTHAQSPSLCLLIISLMRALPFTVLMISNTRSAYK